MGRPLTMEGDLTRCLGVYPPFLSSCGHNQEHPQTRRPRVASSRTRGRAVGWVRVRLEAPQLRGPTQPNPTQRASPTASNIPHFVATTRSNCLSDAPIAARPTKQEPHRRAQTLRTSSRPREAVVIGCEFATIFVAAPLNKPALATTERKALDTTLLHLAHIRVPRSASST
jgi:hypothetical protein